MGASRFCIVSDPAGSAAFPAFGVYKKPLFLASSIPFPPVPVYCAKALPAVQGLPAAYRVWLRR